METEAIATLAALARAKTRLLRHGPVSFFVLSMLAGVYIGVAVVLVFAIGAPLAAASSPATRLVMGASFGVALTLVIFAGSELFTGNNLIMTVGVLARTVTAGAVGRVWLVSFVGNLVGSVAFGAVVAATGLLGKAPASAFVASATAAKMSAPALELFFRGVLCNMLVCVAIWSCVRAKSEGARLVLIFWCLFAFIGSGFEHSVANMTLLSIGLFLPHDPSAISWLGFARNLSIVSLGNIVGGAVVIALPYWAVARTQRRIAGLPEEDAEPAASALPVALESPVLQVARAEG